MRRFARHRMVTPKTWEVVVWAQLKNGFDYVVVDYMTSNPGKHAQRSAKALADRLNEAFTWHIKGGSLGQAQGKQEEERTQTAASAAGAQEEVQA